MPLFTRDIAAKHLRFGSEHVLYAYLGTELVWDGTVPAIVSAPKATAHAAGRPPAVSSSPAAIIAPAAAATVDVVDPNPRASSAPVAVPAEAELAGVAPAVRADMTVTAVVATTSAEAIPTVSDAQVSVPTAVVSAAGVVPNVETTGSAIVLPPPAGSLVDAPTPIVAASKAIVAPAATSSVAGRTGTGFSSGLSAPAASASAAASAPAVAAVNFLPSRMTKSGDSARPGTSYTQVAGGWAPDTTGYPGSSVATDDLIMQTSGTNVTIDTSVVWTNHAFSARTVTMRLVNATTSAVLATMPAALSIGVSSTATATLTATGVTVTAGDHIRLEALSSNINSVSAQTNSASYVRAYLP